MNSTKNKKENTCQSGRQAYRQAGGTQNAQILSRTMNMKVQ